MPQETNLNVAPYFDDFKDDSNYYKVLFKPGFPVQARELTTLQSTLQNQIEDIGTHMFKEGARVIPGDLHYREDFHGIQIDPEYLGVPVGLYLNKLIGKKITGASSGVTAEVVTYITDKESEKNNYTLYLSYINSGEGDDVNTFFDNEVLTTDESINYATTFIAGGEGFATSIAIESNALGSAFSITDGVYYLRGYFVDVHKQVLILDQYDNKPTYRIGLDVQEDVISSDVDPTLSDNAQGFNNFTAPGADRLRITATLAKKTTDDLNNTNFVQITKVENGQVLTPADSSKYNYLGDELARRTWEESGHYYVKEFVTTVRESLNNGTGNRGLYEIGQVTNNGNTPSDDLMIYKVSPGKAFIKGYEVGSDGPSLIDVQKPRDVKTLKGQSINFGFGPSFTVNNLSGSPIIGFNTSNTLSLRSERVGSEKQPSVSHGLAGKEIGVARIYDSALETGSYNTSNGVQNEWDMSLWDLQPYTDLTINVEVDQSAPAYIEGQSSGASAYLRYGVSAGVALTAYDVKGNFFLGERITFNGEDPNTRFITSIKNWEISDIQSFWGSTTPSTGTAVTFTADTIPKKILEFGGGQVTAVHSGISTVTSAGDVFAGIVTTGNLIKYKRPGQTLATYNRVTSVSNTSVTVEAVENLSSVVSGALPTSAETVSSLELVGTKIQKTNGSGNISNNESIYSAFPKKNIQYADLVNSNLIVRRQFNVTIADNVMPNVTAGANETFMPFDAERYTLIRSDGTTEALTSDKMFLSVGNTLVQFRNLGTNDSDCKLIATLKKANVVAKQKIKRVSNNTLIDKSNQSASGIGGTTLNDGLTYGENGNVFPFGTRVQDEIICLNVPDAIKVFGVYESNSTSDPECPVMTVGSLDGATSSTNDLVIGEEIRGESSGARGVYLVRKTDVSLNFIYLNNSTFEDGEIVSFEESGLTAILTSSTSGSRNITSDFSFGTGQRGTFYNYSTIIRKPQSPVPSHKLKVYFAKGAYDNSDSGDITVVNSYNGFNYSTDIPSINGHRNTDIVDARPRVADYTVTAGARSPFEFQGRNFDDGANDGAQHSSKYVLANDESMSLGYSYYLPRVDRLYVDSTGFMSIVKGTSADEPRLPDAISGSMNIANIFMPAYLYNTSDAQVKFIQHKRYQMSDIAKIEERVKNLEYYTSLNQLETETLNNFVPDANGMNRFKSGIYVDNFSSLEPQDLSVGVRNSIDTKRGILRPSHYSTALNMEIASTAIPGIGNGTAQDASLALLSGSNIKRTGSNITLDYEHKWYENQPYATRVENVTPYLVMFWQGIIELTPDCDIWIDVTKMETHNVMQEGSFNAVAQALGAEITTAADGVRMGVSPVEWNSWETIGVNMTLGLSNNQQTFQNATSNQNNAAVQGLLRGINVGNQQILDPSDSVVNNITASGGISLSQQRSGTQSTVREQIDTESLGERIVNRDIIHFMRSRGISFTGKKFKPYSKLYSFFDTVDINRFIVPKLVQIQMTSGTFIPGETVEGIMPGSRNKSWTSSSTWPRITFRVAPQNHKYGATTVPGIANTKIIRADGWTGKADIYGNCPWNRNVIIPSTYSSSSTIMNVDCEGLAHEGSPQFNGWIAKGMIFEGQNSGARATVISDPANGALWSDRVGTIQGCFFVPSSEGSQHPVWNTGRTVFRLTGSKTNSAIKGSFWTAGQTTFYSQGDIDATQETTLSLRNATVDRTEFRETQTIGDTAQSNTIQTVSGFDVVTNVTQDVTEITNITNIDARVTNITNRVDVDMNRIASDLRRRRFMVHPRPRRDPLAQTFIVPDTTGVFASKVDIFFQAKDDSVPVDCEIRTTNQGTPTEEVLAYSLVVKDPEDVAISEDATKATTFEFKSPVYLEPDTEYAIVLKSHSSNYTAWIARMGETDVRTLDSEAGAALVSQQPHLGSLFKSQNAAVWTPSQYEDLKFELYRADFKSEGSATFYNPPLPTKLEAIPENGISISPRKVSVGIGTTIQDQGLIIGNEVKQIGAGSSGTVVAFGGSIGSYSVTGAGDFDITTAGIGYTPSTGTFNFTGVAFTGVTGNGLNGKGYITITDGICVGAGISNYSTSDGGKGYAIGDVITPLAFGNEEVGEGIQLTVKATYGNNELILSNVQGTFGTGGSDRLYYQNSVGVTTEMNYSVGGNVQPQTPIRTTTDGLHLKINQKNHGMYSSINQVTLSDIASDITPTSLSAAITRTSTATITVASNAEYTTFENVGVGATNPGYVKIDSEVIKYTGTSGSTQLTGITRAIGTSKGASHDVGDLVEKYELDGVSLLRINNKICDNYTHDLGDVTVSDPIGLDYYHIRVDMSSGNSSGNTVIIDRRASGQTSFVPLYFKQETTAGGVLAKGTYNIPFSLIIPKVETIIPTGCAIQNRMRTISGATVGGSELTYLDQGYDDITLYQKNYFNSQRMVASQQNEDTYCTDLPGNKSLTLLMAMSARDPRVSPMINLEHVAMTFVNNRINNPISNFATDMRVNRIDSDPSRFFYVTKNIILENPATSLQVLLDGYCANPCDIRVFYALNQDTIAKETIFIPFPGYTNLDIAGNIITPTDSNGLPDTKVPKVDVYASDPGLELYKEYKYSQDELPPFSSYRIKIIGTSTDGAVVPQIQRLRCLALA